jgi:hypothetical protein
MGGKQFNLFPPLLLLKKKILIKKVLEVIIRKKYYLTLGKPYQALQSLKE